MERKKNEQERAKYYRLILQKEEQLDELTNTERTITDAMENLEEDLGRGFQTVAMLNDDVTHDGTSKKYEQQRHDDEQEQVFRQLLHESKEQIAAAYRKGTNKVDEERETLYKKRSELS